MATQTNLCEEAMDEVETYEEKALVLTGREKRLIDNKDRYQGELQQFNAQQEANKGPQVS